MKKNLMTFEEFIKRFFPEELCEIYLYNLRWKDGYLCPKCGNNKKPWITKRGLYACRNRECDHHASLTAGTIFQSTRKPLRDWFIAIWWVVTQEKGANAKEFQKYLRLGSYETAWAWLHKIRSAMVSPNRTKLSGEIEVIKSYIGGKNKEKPGKSSKNKAHIAVATEIKDKKFENIRLSVIKDVSNELLTSFIAENIEKGSKIITYDETGFSGMELKGYELVIHRQSKAVDNIVSLLKRWLIGTYQGAIESKYLQAYLDEFVFRFNHKTDAERGLLFYRLLENAMAVSPLK